MIDPTIWEELLPLTVPEVRRLLRWVVVRGAVSLGEPLAWSRWRRRHQARAKRCHYRCRLARLKEEVRL